MTNNSERANQRYWCGQNEASMTDLRLLSMTGTKFQFGNSTMGFLRGVNWSQFCLYFLFDKPRRYPVVPVLKRKSMLNERAVQWIFSCVLNLFPISSHFHHRETLVVSSQNWKSNVREGFRDISDCVLNEDWQTYTSVLCFVFSTPKKLPFHCTTGWRMKN